MDCVHINDSVHACEMHSSVMWCCAGKEAVTQGRNSLAAKLAASPVWLSLTLDADTFPSTGQQVPALLCFWWATLWKHFLDK